MSQDLGEIQNAEMRAVVYVNLGKGKIIGSTDFGEIAVVGRRHHIRAGNWSRHGHLYG